MGKNMGREQVQIPRLRPGAKLRAADLDRLPDGFHGDGNCLYARIGPGHARSWVYRYRAGARLVDVGLGSMRSLTLADARARAARITAQRLDGIDPREARQSAKAARRASVKTAKKEAVTFGEIFERYLADHRAAWSSDKHAANWRAQLTKHALPRLERMPVSKIDVDVVVRILRPIWTTIPETAGRIRLRLEKVLDYAKVHGHRSGDNPARLAGNLALILPSHARIARVEHFAAMPWREIPIFYAHLAAMEPVTAKALQLIILTAIRTSDALNAPWSEIDFEQAVWAIPAARMKARRAHRVPLSAPALVILRALEALGSAPGAPIFPNPGGKFYSNVAILALLRRMGRRDVTVHGFRSSFRDWMSEATDFRPEIAEAALAHAVPDATVAAYARSDFFDRRRALMDQWAAFVTGAP
jgi:integrase